MSAAQTSSQQAYHTARYEVQDLYHSTGRTFAPAWAYAPGAQGLSEAPSRQSTTAANVGSHAALTNQGEMVCVSEGSPLKMHNLNINTS